MPSVRRAGKCVICKEKGSPGILVVQLARQLRQRHLCSSSSPQDGCKQHDAYDRSGPVCCSLSDDMHHRRVRVLTGVVSGEDAGPVPSWLPATANCFQGFRSVRPRLPFVKSMTISFSEGLESPSVGRIDGVGLVVPLLRHVGGVQCQVRAFGGRSERVGRLLCAHRDLPHSRGQVQGGLARSGSPPACHAVQLPSGGTRARCLGAPAGGPWGDDHGPHQEEWVPHPRGGVAPASNAARRSRRLGCRRAPIRPPVASRVLRLSPGAAANFTPRTARPHEYDTGRTGRPERRLPRYAHPSPAA